MSETPTCSEGGHRRTESSEPHDAVDDHVGIDADLGGSVAPGDDLDTLGQQRDKLGGFGLISDGDNTRTHGTSLSRRNCHAAVHGEGIDHELAVRCSNDLKGLNADRTGGANYCN